MQVFWLWMTRRQHQHPALFTTGAGSNHHGRLAQMVERSLSMREAPGSIPGLSTLPFFFPLFYLWKLLDLS